MLHSGIRDAYKKGISELKSCEGVTLEYISDENSGNEGTSHVGPCVLSACVSDFLNDPAMMEEVFGPSTLLISYDDPARLLDVASKMEGQLTASIFGKEEDLKQQELLISHLEIIAGRILFNQFPTGVEVCPSIVHGGPYPATTDGRSTSGWYRCNPSILPVQYVSRGFLMNGYLRN